MRRWIIQGHEEELTQVLVFAGIGTAIGGNFDIDADSDPDTDSDPEISRH